MIWPFIKKERNQILVRLNSKLYSKELIENLCKQAKDNISSVKLEKGYHLVELRTASQEDYLDFLNYLIFLQRKNVQMGRIVK